LLLKNKKVVVVGGSSGIGYATAELAKSEGATVTIASRPGERLQGAAQRLGVRAIEADVTSDASIEALFRTCGRVDHVVVTAAQLKSGPFRELSMADARATMESKFWAPGGWRAAQTSRRAARLPSFPASSACGRGRQRPSSARRTARSKRSPAALRSSSRRCA